MSLPKKRKIDAEHGVFKIEWTSKYFLTDVAGKAVYLVLKEIVAVFKEYNTISDVNRKRYASLLIALHAEFSRRLIDFKMLENNMALILSPFTFSVDNAPIDHKLELIDLQSDALLGEQFKSVLLLRFHASLNEQNFQKIRVHAQKILVRFGSTYVCEQTFSVMKFNKSKNRSSISCSSAAHCNIRNDT
ncbi:GT2D2 protein, partial [Amia calva]|nr:GT2D2 protein [Amia calva]